MKVLTALLFSVSCVAVGQPPQVPHKMHFAGMTLTIRDDARREIQKDVDAITQSPKHFNIKVERARTYFPIIEKIFEAERVPDDFKYLVIQESALISDAVSVSNAVGFWQFKDFTALEMGLRVDKEVDERLNIVSSSRAAARYIKKNNFYFNNWLYALQAYQMGAGAVLRSVPNSQSGAKHMEITSSTYWYVKKYLAHKVAYENAVMGPGQIKALMYETQSRKTLTDISKELAVEESELVSYNKWAKAGIAPGDRPYVVVVPVKGDGNVNLTLPDPAFALAKLGDEKAIKAVSYTPASPTTAKDRRKINGVSVLAAQANESPTQFASRAGVDLASFLKWNEISISDRLVEGQPYFVGKKRSRAEQSYHTVSAGESIWSISQKYGVQQRKLKRYNRLSSDQPLRVGSTLWLASVKPKDSDVNTPVAEVALLDQSRTFSWGVQADESPLPEQTIEPAESEAKPEQTLVPAIPDSIQTLQVDTTVYVAADTVQRINPVPVVISKPEFHTVKSGETLYAIAKQYEVGVMDLVNWNSLDLQAGIKPGQVLKLSEAQPVAEEGVLTSNKGKDIEHQVKSSDTLYSIARQYGVTIKELMEWNGKKDFTLSVGEKLRVVQK